MQRILLQLLLFVPSIISTFSFVPSQRNRISAFTTTVPISSSSYEIIKRKKESLLVQNAFSTSGMWNAGLSYGKGPFRFYTSFDEFMSPFLDEDREAFPELFNLPSNVYEVSLPKPLGIVFEEIEAGKGVYVADLVEGGNAERKGIIQKGDVLIGVTAIKVIGAKWERRLLPAIDFDFDTVVGAIGSNEDRWGCEDVVLQFWRKGSSDDDDGAVEEEADVRSFMQFFNPPGDSPWRQ